tara:strand:+ start:64 stop:444 length:381 start_codon:yes stop_codon:yes gene_type:complete
MDKAFKELLHLIKLSRTNCPWQETHTLEAQKQEFLDEANEVVEAVDNKDWKNLKEELGDVLWDTLTLATMAEEQGHFKAEDIIKSINDKIARRKPYIFEKHNLTKQEALDVWNKEKIREGKQPREK